MSCNPIWDAEIEPSAEHPIARGVAPFTMLDEWYFGFTFSKSDRVQSILVATPSDEVRAGPYVWPAGPYPHIVAARGRRETLDVGDRAVGRRWPGVRPGRRALPCELGERRLPPRRLERPRLGGRCGGAACRGGIVDHGRGPREGPRWRGVGGGSSTCVRVAYTYNLSMTGTADLTSRTPDTLLDLPADFVDRVYAGVLGKIIGVYLGRPVEGWTYERIQERFGDIDYYVHDRLGRPAARHRRRHHRDVHVRPGHGGPRPRPRHHLPPDRRILAGLSDRGADHPVVERTRQLDRAHGLPPPESRDPGAGKRLDDPERPGRVRTDRRPDLHRRLGDAPSGRPGGCGQPGQAGRGGQSRRRRRSMPLRSSPRWRRRRSSRTIWIVSSMSASLRSRRTRSSAG